MSIARGQLNIPARDIMEHRAVFFTGMALMFSLALSLAATPASQAAPVTDADTLVRTCLPAASWHFFEKPAFKWEEITAWLRPDDGTKAPHSRAGITYVVNYGGVSLVMVENPTLEEKKHLYREDRYYRPDSPPDHRQSVKIACYFPNGSRYGDIDQEGDSNFSRQFFPNGVLQQYLQQQGMKWIAGMAVNPVTGTPNYFSGGTGSLQIFSNTPGTFETRWYQDGDVFLHEDVKDSKRTTITLCVGVDSLRITKSGEELILATAGECWRREGGEDITAQDFDALAIENGKVVRTKVPPATDIRLMPLVMGGPDPQKAMAQIHREWKVAYPKRRQAFLDRIGRILAKSGQTWDSLKLTFVRDDFPWPRDS